jgi:hypothetical protein
MEVATLTHRASGLQGGPEFLQKVQPAEVAAFGRDMYGLWSMLYRKARRSWLTVAQFSGANALSLSVHAL